MTTVKGRPWRRGCRVRTDNSQRLALGGLVTRFMTVEGTGDASDHVLDVVNRVDLSEDGTDATLAPVAVDRDGEVRLKAA